ncbi:ABC transporter family protein [Actinidia rufa]|uniref:ABC transporter family protein n=1 Tax=Actinidia rufa TaxID=165716 RepID=A0A7J0DAT6_9ERIC|nr:ABC transporter family protein [Actinidia rufa]
MGEKIGEGSRKKRNGSFRSIFMHADHTDVLLMILGFLGALGDGLSMPLVILVTSKLMNNIGGASASVADAFTQNINKNAVALCYVACGQWVACFLGEVQFKHVEFAYPSRPETTIFKDFNLLVPAGLTVALVGGSGSGKSTVVALLQRFYDPLGGEILLDGVAIDKVQLRWLRSQMGLVSQEPALFATTIKENILFGKEDADMDEVVAAAKASNAHNFISQLPQGYDTQARRTYTHWLGYTPRVDKHSVLHAMQ